jgi:hypothetical protein
MNRSTLWCGALLGLLAIGCGPGEVIVTVEVDMLDPESGEVVPRNIEDLLVQLVPFDRDFIFDSLTRAADTPEPQFPAELMARRDSLLVFQQEWRDAEAEWLALRERLEEIVEEMEIYNPAEARYQQLFREFDQVETRYLAAERRKDEAFARFDELQQATFSELQEARAQIEGWADEAFAPYGQVVQDRLRESRREILSDTTDATGRARFRPSPGEWWIHARYPLPTAELYWNVPIQVDRGDPLELRLTRQNAQERDIF